MSTSKVRAFERIVVIVFENEYCNYVKRHPYMRALAAQGIEVTNYFGVMHPSNTNYVASIAGEICNITADPTYYTLMPAPYTPQPGPAPLTQRSLVDLVEGRGLSWKAYMESYKPVAFPPRLTPVMRGSTVDQVATVKQTILDYPPYINAHNPFVRFQSIMESEDRWTRIQSSYDFLRDALNDTLPEYAWFTPDIWADGHWLWGTYTEPGQRGVVLVDQLSRWLETFFGVLDFPGPRSRVPPGTLVVVTFDESDFDTLPETFERKDGDYDGLNQIYTVLLGDMIEPGVEHEGYNHYSLLKTVETNFGLGDLGKNDAASNWLQFLWGERFRWSAPVATPLTSARAVAAAALGDTLHVVSVDPRGGLDGRSYASGAWSEGASIPGPAGVSAVEMAACGREIVLVYQAGGGLGAITYEEGVGWSEPASVVGQAPGAFALTSFTDYGDQTEKLMLAYQIDGNGIQSQVFSGGAWSAPVTVGFETDGDVVLAVIGPSLYLIHKAMGSDQMNVVSYNTAPFNAVTAASSSDDDTSQYAWSPSEYPVAFFGYGSVLGNLDAKASQLRPYKGLAPFAAATLNGVIHLAHPGVQGAEVQTETFSISGILTPSKPISYDKSTAGNSNGYGTLAEAGWSKPGVIVGVTSAAGGAMAMARLGSDLFLLFQPEAGGALRLSVGGYTTEEAGT